MCSLYSDPTRSEFFWVPPSDDDHPPTISTSTSTSASNSASAPPSLQHVPEDERFYIIAGELIRLRVISETFSDVTPKVAPKVQQPAPAAAAAAAAAATAQTQDSTATTVVGPPPYRLEGSIQEAGLGLLDWWKGGDDQQIEQFAEVVEANN